MKTIIRQHIVMMCLITPVFFLFVLPVQSVTTNVPSSFYMEFEGALDNEDYSFLVILTNETKIPQKNLTLTFSMDENEDNNYSIHLVVETEDIFKELSTEGYISDGQLIVNSRRTLFLINQTLLNEGDHIELAETMEGTLSGNVSTIGKPETAIANLRIRARVILAYHVIDSQNTLPLVIGFDPDTGLLVYAACVLSDVLLEEMGITYIYGGSFNLRAYSDNLDFMLIELHQSISLTWILVITMPAFFLFLVIALYHMCKTNKLKERKKTLNFTSECNILKKRIV